MQTRVHRKRTVGFFQFGRFSAASYGRVIAKVWQLDARTLWARDATVASEQTAEFVFRVKFAVLGRIGRDFALSHAVTALGLRPRAANFTFVRVRSTRNVQLSHPNFDFTSPLD